MHSEGSINKIKRQSVEWEEIFIKSFDKWLISKIYKELIQLNIKKKKQLKMGGRPE